MYNIEDVIDRGDLSSFKNGDRVFVMSTNLFDIFEAQILKITKDGIVVYYKQFKNVETAPPNLVLPLTQNNDRLFQRQEKIRLAMYKNVYIKTDCSESDSSSSDDSFCSPINISSFMKHSDSCCSPYKFNDFSDGHETNAKEHSEPERPSNIDKKEPEKPSNIDKKEPEKPSNIGKINTFLI